MTSRSSSAKVTSKGQTTIPKDIRDRFHIRAGDSLDWVVGPDGALRVHPKTRSIKELRGILQRPGAKPVALDEMERGLGQGLARKHAPKGGARP